MSFDGVRFSKKLGIYVDVSDDSFKSETFPVPVTTDDES